MENTLNTEKLRVEYKTENTVLATQTTKYQRKSLFLEYFKVKFIIISDLLNYT